MGSCCRGRGCSRRANRGCLVYRTPLDHGSWLPWCAASQASGAAVVVSRGQMEQTPQLSGSRAISRRVGGCLAVASTAVEVYLGWSATHMYRPLGLPGRERHLTPDYMHPAPCPWRRDMGRRTHPSHRRRALDQCSSSGTRRQRRDATTLPVAPTSRLCASPCGLCPIPSASAFVPPSHRDRGTWTGPPSVNSTRVEPHAVLVRTTPYRHEPTAAPTSQSTTCLMRMCRRPPPCLPPPCLHTAAAARHVLLAPSVELGHAALKTTTKRPRGTIN